MVAANHETLFYLFNIITKYEHYKFLFHGQVTSM